MCIDRALNENEIAEPQKAVVIFARFTGGCSASVFMGKEEQFPWSLERSGEAVF